MGRRAAASGVSAPAGGLVQQGCTPHFLFGLARKENGPCTVQKKRALGALQCSGPPRATGVDVSVQAPIWPGLQARYNLLPGRYCRPVADGAQVVGVVVALSCFSFRCRWPPLAGIGATGGCGHPPLQSRRGPNPSVGADALIGPLQKPHQPPASGSENRRGMYPRLPRAKGLPKGSAFPSLTAARDRQPSPAGGRRSALAQTDPPNIFSFPPGAAHFLFDVSKRKWGAHPLREQESLGAAERRPTSPSG